MNISNETLLLLLVLGVILLLVVMNCSFKCKGIEGFEDHMLSATAGDYYMNWEQHPELLKHGDMKKVAPLTMANEDNQHVTHSGYMGRPRCDAGY